MAGGGNILTRIILDLRDRTSRGLDGILARLRRLAGAGAKIGAIGAIAAGISFVAPIMQAAAFDQQLRDIAVTAGRTGQGVGTMIGDLKKQFFELATATAQKSTDIAEGAGTMIAAGVDEALVRKLLPTIAKVSTASSAAFKDIAMTAVTMASSLGVPAEEMEAMFAHLVQGGKAGRFELNNMAKFFPALGAEMAKLKVTGQEGIDSLVAMLQMAMQNTASPDEAANNVKNFLMKLNSPETKKHFEKAGVDLTGLMQNAAAKGINPIEAVVQKVMSITKISQAEIADIMAKARANGATEGEALIKAQEQIMALGQASKLGELFTDQQAMAGILPLLTNLQNYKQIREELAGSDTKLIDDDFASQMAGLNQEMTIAKENITQLTDRVGMAFARILPTINKGFDGVKNGIAWVDEHFPGLVDGALVAVGAFAALAVVAGVIGMVSGPVIGIFALLGKALMSVVGIIKFAIGFIKFAAWALQILTIAVRVLSIALIANPIGLIFAAIGLAIAALAYVVYTYWDDIVAFAAEVWPKIVGFVSDAWGAISNTIKAVWGAINAWLTAAWDGVASWASGVWSGIVGGIIGAFAGLKNGIANTWQGVSDYLTAAWGGVASWAAGVWSGVANGVTSAFSGLKDGIAEKWQVVDNYLTSAWGDLTGRAAKVWSNLSNGAKNAWSWISDSPETPEVDMPALDVTNPAELARAAGLLSELTASSPAVQSALEQVLNGCNALLAATSWTDHGRRLMQSLIDGASHGSPAAFGGLAAAMVAGAATDQDNKPSSVASAAGGGVQTVGGQIVVKVDGPGAVTSVKSDNPAVPIEPDRGSMRDRS